ncbi:MAG: GIY-YIG nuclease family protein [Bacteroidales bacterium]|nr:GIY-YIG nuclease family protein [Bacteroidales bacterium]
MKFGKTIKIFLIDGDPNGRMTCELSNWTGKAYKIPRIKVKDCTDRDDLQNTGIYLLFGKDDEGKDQVYIGEAEVILKRLNQQINQKEFWNETILFSLPSETGKPGLLKETDITLIRGKIIRIARACLATDGSEGSDRK